jgi:hypothetical protein
MAMATESSPLLHVPAPVFGSSAQPLPTVTSTLARIQYVNIEELTVSDILGSYDPTASTKTSFVLIILLQWRINKIQERISPRDVWDQWSKEKNTSLAVDQLEALILKVWTDFVTEYRTPQDIENVLWFKFPHEEEGTRFVRGALI